MAPRAGNLELAPRIAAVVTRCPPPALGAANHLQLAAHTRVPHGAASGPATAVPAAHLATLPAPAEALPGRA